MWMMPKVYVGRGGEERLKVSEVSSTDTSLWKEEMQKFYFRAKLLAPSAPTPPECIIQIISSASAALAKVVINMP